MESNSSNFHAAETKEKRDLATMRYLLDNGFDVNANSNGKYTPLHLAVAFNWPEGVEMLVARGADCNAQGNWVEYVTKFYQILVKELQNGMSPLHLAAIVGEEKIVEILLANGAKLEAKTERGYTPLYYAIEKLKPNVYLRLLDAGADPLQIELESHIALLNHCLLGNGEKAPENEERSPKIG